MLVWCDVMWWINQWSCFWKSLSSIWWKWTDDVDEKKYSFQRIKLPISLVIVVLSMSGSHVRYYSAVGLGLDLEGLVLRSRWCCVCVCVWGVGGWGWGWATEVTRWEDDCSLSSSRGIIGTGHNYDGECFQLWGWFDCRFSPNIDLIDWINGSPQLKVSWLYLLQYWKQYQWYIEYSTSPTVAS